MHCCSMDFHLSCHYWLRSVFGHETTASSAEFGQHSVAAAAASTCCSSCFPSWSAWQAQEFRQAVEAMPNQSEWLALLRTVLCHCVSCRVVDMATMELHEREPRMEICTRNKEHQFVLLKIEYAFVRNILKTRKKIIQNSLLEYLNGSRSIFLLLCVSTVEFIGCVHHIQRQHVQLLIFGLASVRFWLQQAHLNGAAILHIV